METASWWMDCKKNEYEGWEEVVVSSERGRREVHYYLVRKAGPDGVTGGSDLAVIGRERSQRHMSYHVVLPNTTPPPPPSQSSSQFKLMSRKHVLDWLNRVVSDSSPYQSSQPLCASMDNDLSDSDAEGFKDFQSPKMGPRTREFAWIGSPWTCRKRRNHYMSFSRNGVKISVHEFVYVLAEEGKRLVAYLRDMYEDLKGNKLVSVRWFHKIEEVGFVLPHNFNDGEIFFSSCLQDLSIECIDGLATVLSPQHFKQFQNEVTHRAKLDIFVCDKLFENDDIRSFDITRVRGYWNQDLVMYLNNTISLDENPLDGSSSTPFGMEPRKKRRVSGDGKPVLLGGSHIDNIGGIGKCSLDAAALPPRTAAKQSPFHCLKVGSKVEVLSQDSGIRGCWFRAVVIKRHRDKVKVRYQDIDDASDESKKLEEWVLASRVAVPDESGVHVCGRTVVRPHLPSSGNQASLDVDFGSVVDAWWQEAWWEGIIVKKESEHAIHVYFPGEKTISVFSSTELRQSLEWFGNKWMPIKNRPDIATKYIPSHSSSEKKNEVVKLKDRIFTQYIKAEAGFSDDHSNSGAEKARDCLVVPDLVKDAQLSELRWKTSKKRRRGSMRNSLVIHQNVEKFCIQTILTVDHENCKYLGDSLFSSQAVKPLTSLVMSR